MQDQNQKNRQPGQSQQGMGSSETNWQSQGNQANQSTGNNEGQDWDDNTEVDMPQQPRHKEEPIEGQNWNKSDSQKSGQGSQENVQGNRMGSDMGSNTGSGSMGSQSNQGEGMRGGSMSDQGTMSDQRGNKTSDKSGAQEKESDDYMRNDIGTSTSGSSGTNRNADR